MRLIPHKGVVIIDEFRSLNSLRENNFYSFFRLNNHQLKLVGWNYGLKVRIRVK